MINEWPECGIIGTYAIETQELTKRFILDRGFLDAIRNYKFQLSVLSLCSRTTRRLCPVLSGDLLDAQLLTG
jgi:hypothetical protein